MLAVQKAIEEVLVYDPSIPQLAKLASVWRQGGGAEQARPGSCLRTHMIGLVDGYVRVLEEMQCSVAVKSDVQDIKEAQDHYRGLKEQLQSQRDVEADALQVKGHS